MHVIFDKITRHKKNLKVSHALHDVGVFLHFSSNFEVFWNISTKLIENQPHIFGWKDFTIAMQGKNSQSPNRVAMYLTNQHGLKKSHRGTPMEHIYKII